MHTLLPTGALLREGIKCLRLAGVCSGAGTGWRGASSNAWDAGSSSGNCHWESVSVGRMQQGHAPCTRSSTVCLQRLQILCFCSDRQHMYPAAAAHLPGCMSALLRFRHWPMRYACTLVGLSLSCFLHCCGPALGCQPTPRLVSCCTLAGLLLLLLLPCCCLAVAVAGLWWGC